jgi:hypothetical protein
LTDGEKAILRKNRDAQREQSFEAVRDQLRARLPFVETPTQSTGGGRGSSGDGSKERLASNNLTALEDIYKGDDATVQRGLEYVFGLDPNYRTGDVKTNANNERVLMLTYYDTKEKKLFTREIPIGDSLSGWVESASTQFFDDSQRGYIDRAYEKLPKDRKNAAPGSGVGHAENTPEEEVVGYDTLIDTGFDPETGKAVNTTPRGLYNASVNSNDSLAGVISAATSALKMMGFEEFKLMQGYLEPSGYRDNENSIIYYVPEYMPYGVFIPEDDDGKAAMVNSLNELMAKLRDQGGTAGVSDLQGIIGTYNWDTYNTDEFRDMFGVNEGAPVAGHGGITR